MPKIIAYEVKLNGIETAVTNSQQLNDAIKETRKELTSKEFGSSAFQELNKQLANLKNSQSAVTDETRKLQAELRAAGQAGTGSYRALAAELSSLTNKYKELTAAERSSPLGDATLKSIQKLQTELKGIDATMGNYQRNVGNYKSAWLDTLTGIAPQTSQFFTQTTNQAGAATVGLNKLGLASVGVGAAVAVIGKALEVNAKVSDLKSDVVKTANLTQTEIDSLVESLKKLDTRTGLDSLLKISAIGGQLGVTGKQGVSDFTQSVDKLAVALGDEFTGGAGQVADEVGRLSNVFFGVTKDGTLLSKNILSVGNALNVLSADGAATAPVMTDFASRIGRIAIPLGLTQGQVLGLSATLQELNVNAEQGGTAVQRLLTAISNDRANVAKVLGLDLKDFTQLLNTDLNAALNLVISRVGELGKTNTDLSDILKTLKIDGQGELSVFLALGENQELLKAKTDLATESLKGQSSILSEFATKNDNLAGSLDKLKNSFENAFVNSRSEEGLKTIINSVAALLSGVSSLGTEIGDLIDKLVKDVPILDSILGSSRQFVASKESQLSFKSGGALQNLGLDNRNKYRTEAQIAQQDIKDRSISEIGGISNPFANLRGSGGVPFANGFAKDVKTNTPPKPPSKDRSGKSAKADPSVKAAQDIADELKRIEEQRADAIEKVRKEKFDARARAIDDDEQKEIALEDRRFAERFAAIRDRGQKIEDDAIDKAEKLKGKEGVTQAQINKILSDGKAARLAIEIESNTLIASEFDEHRKKLEDIESKYNEKAIKQIEAAQKQRTDKLLSSLGEQLQKVDEATNDARFRLENSRGTISESKFNASNSALTINSLNQKKGTIQQTLQGALIANALASTNNQEAIFNIDELQKLKKQVIDIEKDITKATADENKQRKKDDDETKKQRKKNQKEILDAAIDGAKTVLDSVAQLNAANQQAETDLRLRELDKQYAKRLEAAQGNADEEARIQKELDDKKKAIQKDAIKRESEAAKLQAAINGALAITKILAEYPKADFGIATAIGIAASAVTTGLQIAIIDKNAKAQIEALAQRGGAFETTYLDGERHGRGGRMIGNVEAERGEAVMQDEEGRTVVVNRNSAAAFRSQLQAMQGKMFKGKGAMLSSMNAYNGYGQKFALGGAITPNYLPIVSGQSGVQYVTTTATIDKATMNELVERVAVAVQNGAKDGAMVGTYQGAVTGANETNRIAERQAALNQKTNR